MVALLSPPDWDVAMLVWESVSPPSGRFIGAAGVATFARQIYATAYAGRTAWAKRLVSLRAGRVVDTDEIMPRSEHTQSDFYRSFLSTWGMELAVAVILDRRGPERLALLITGPPDRDLSGLKRGLRLLAPHIQRAVRISGALGQANLRVEAAEAAMEASPAAVLMLSTDLKVVSANQKAEQLAARGVAAFTRNGFSFTDRTAQARLTEMAKASPPASAAFVAHYGDGQETAVLAARFPTQTAPTLTGPMEGAGLLVLVGLSGRAPLIAIDRLAAWYGLTPAEGRVAAALADGRSLREHAAERAISENAVKFLLKGVFRKTGATTQAQLVKLLRDLPIG